MRIDYSLIRQILFSIESENIREKLCSNEISFKLSDKQYYSDSIQLNEDDIIAYHINYLHESFLVTDISANVDSTGKFTINLGFRTAPIC